MTTIIKLAKDLNDLPSDHKRIYQCIIPDSVRKIVAEAKESYFSGDQCGKFSFGEWLKFSLFQVWTVEQAIEACIKYLDKDSATISKGIKLLILREFCRITKYISYGYLFSNLEELLKSPFPIIPDPWLENN